MNRVSVYGCRRGFLRSRLSIVSAAAVLATLLNVPAYSQPIGNTDIIVVGPTVGENQSRAAVNAYVRGLGVLSSHRPLARWIDPICPRVIGLTDPAIVARTLNRLAAIADEVGVPHAKTGCDTNLLLIFTEDGRDLTQRINRRRSRSVTAGSLTARRALLDSEAPVRWWYNSEIRDRDGGRGVDAPMPWTGGGEGGVSPVVIPDGATSISHYGSSLVSSQVVRALTSATVVIDVTRAHGHNFDALIEYAALVALAEIAPSDTPPEDSVLGLFVAAPAPAGLSHFDRRFLLALYALPLDRTIRFQRGYLTDALLERGAPLPNNQSP